MESQSNLPPSAEEEVILRESLRQRRGELQAIDDDIFKARDAIASASRALDALTRSSARARSALDSKNTKGDRNLPRSHLINTVSAKSQVSDEMLEKLEALSISADHNVAPGEENQSKMSRDQLETMVSNLEDAMRRQRLVVNVNSTSIVLYSLARRLIQDGANEIEEKFRVIKRVPDEVWYEILTVRISQKSHFWPQAGDPPISIPALSYTHVCRSWRRVVMSSPSMWRSIHWNLDPEEEPNRELIDLWMSKAPENERRIYERQSFSELTAAGLAHTKLELPIHEKLQYYIHQTRKQLRYGRVGDTDTPINLPSLFLQASKSSTRIPKLQSQLVHRFPKLESLHLQDMLPRDPVYLPTSLTHLAVSFSVTHDVYTLHDLLKPSLKSLKLSHFSADVTPRLGSVIELPNLHTLDITPLEHSIIRHLVLPSLDTLFISPPRNKAATCPTGWLESLVLHCANVGRLKFDWPSSLTDGAPVLDRLQAFFDLRRYMPKLRSVKFTSGPIKGSALADFLTTDQYGRLEKLTVDGCVGVSRMDCERLVQLVDTLNVYRSVHGVPAAEEPQE